MVSGYRNLNFLLILAVVLFLSAAQYTTVRNNFGKNIDAQISATKGVVDGVPHWKIYQSRILGPYMVSGLQIITKWSFGKAYLVMMNLWLLLFFLVLIFVAISVGYSVLSGIGFAFAAAFINSLLMRGDWLYPWDFINLTLSSLVIWAILTNKRLEYLVLLILLEMLNHDHVLIILGWLLLDSFFCVRREQGKWPTIRFRFCCKQLILSVLLIITSIVVMEYLRSILLIREAGPELFNELLTKDTEQSVQLKVMINLNSFRNTIGCFNEFSIINVLVFAIPAIAFTGFFSTIEEVSRVCLLFFVLWVFTVVFGLIYETRVWTSFTPFLTIVFPMMIEPGSMHIKSD